jgi:hypothetical protein
MTKLTKGAIAVTALSAAALLITGNTSQSLVSDGKRCFSIVTWHIPAYGSVRLDDSAWWIFTKIWLPLLLALLLVWLAVGIRGLSHLIRSPRTRSLT